MATAFIATIRPRNDSLDPLGLQIPSLDLQIPTLVLITPSYRHPPPTKPLTWLWSCHICKRSYPLGVTRRCLDCGHLFCAGVTEVKQLSRKVGHKVYKHHKACASEFDYGAWKEWNEWRRGEKNAGKKSGGEEEVARRMCWEKCNFPSQCRWGPVEAQVYGGAPADEQTTTTTTTTTTTVTVSQVKKTDGTKKESEIETKKDRLSQLFSSTLRRTKSSSVAE